MTSPPQHKGEPNRAFWNGEWFDPNRESASGLMEDGLLRGQGLIEILRVRTGQIEFVDEHIRRFIRSADTLRIPVPYDAAGLADVLNDCVKRTGAGDLTLRISIAEDRKSGLMTGDTPSPVNLLVRAERHLSLPQERLVGGLALATSAAPKDETSVSIHHKTLASFRSNRERLASLPIGADEALVLNRAGRVAGAASANLFLVAGSVLITPPVEEGAFPGIMRRTVIRSAHDSGFSVEERAIEPDELLTSPEVFLSGSVIGLAAVAQIDGQQLPDPTLRPMIPQLRIRYRQLAEAPTGRAREHP